MPIALDRSVTLVTTPPARIRTATGDRRRVEQILTNLAANAHQVQRRAGGASRSSAASTGRVGVIAVRDEGAGIGAEDRGRIFDRFHRMAEPRAR